MVFKKKLAITLMFACIVMLVAGENTVTDKEQAVTGFDENFSDGKLSTELWQRTENGIELNQGAITVSCDGQIRSQTVFPYGSLEFKMTVTKPVTCGSIGWGFREKPGGKPRITFSLEENMVLRAAVLSDKNKSIVSANTEVDIKEHSYRIDWSEKEIKFYFDGKILFKTDVPNDFSISPRPVIVYNADSDAAVKISSISYKTSDSPEKTAEIQSKIKFVMQSGRDMKCKEVIHLDEIPLPQISDFWTERKYIIFTRPYIQHCYQKDTPEADEILDMSKGIRIFATPGEYEPLSFAVHALDAVKEYKVKTTDLISKDNKTISSENIQIGAVKDLNKKFLYAFPDYMLIPTFIETRDQVDIEKGTNRQLWLTLHVPENAAPGIYTGMVEFASIYGPEGGMPAEIPVTIEILPFRLEEPTGYSFAFWHPTNSCYTKESIAADFLKMRQHGINTVFGGGSGISGVSAISQNEMTEKDGKIEFKFSNDSKFLWMIEAYKTAGFSGKILCTRDKASHWADRKSKVRFSQEWNAEYMKYMKSFNEMLRKNNYPNFIFQPIDEPAWHGESTKKLFLDLVKLLKEAGAETEIDGPFNNFMVETALPYCDVLNINGGLPSLEKIKELKAQGKTLWAYNNDVEGIRPETMRYSAGYWLWVAGADGVQNWGFNHKEGKIYDDLTVAGSNFVYFYPKTETETGGPSLSFEAFREGIDDLRYLLTWAKAVRKLKDSGMATEAEASEKNINSLMEKVKYLERVRDSSAFAKTYYKADGQKFLIGDFKLPNQLKYNDYDQIRYAIAKEIEKIIALKK